MTLPGCGVTQKKFERLCKYQKVKDEKCDEVGSGWSLNVTGLKTGQTKPLFVNLPPGGGAPERKNGKNDDTFRSYQLDFFKFILAIYVFISHTQCFVGENTRIKLPANIGGDSVHVFFIISGMLMANSIYKHYSDQYISQPGKGAMTFLMSKVKSMLPQSMAALLISFSVLSICVYKDLNAILYNLTTIFPEMFFINQAGMDIQIGRAHV